ncbi:MAG: hypothetical protein A2287_02620 [Candidatus Melainabacteria bacterium RIFOXYA12_FULL_32_12]|nr:MAG: hypothetical protein A2104_00435 [Candidatus Melainabacteria bacterium GWF2_32_7]OGI19909.1 MAG: hypothetical protein A2255_08650 [Candidatus Melainabacteria bacterium RIFOXYA2_FULL_32_9]OGI30824.1 MAG: hypothetical protein A2287_02620 [Candidatus Melainabacteria bacterium RIFOXYA12_FULL_32_12]
MRKYSSKKGNNLFEYTLTALLVGAVTGYSLYSISPSTFTNFFTSVFYGGSTSGSTITIGPIGE